MKGLELSRAYYEEYGAPMLKERFPELYGLVAVGLCGAGSECFGFDDDLSRDHDFEPGFCVFLPGEDLVDSRAEFNLERAYAKLPKDYAGLTRLPFPPAGGPRKGVLRISEFFLSKTGRPDGALTVGQWLSIPEQYLAEATNGEIFYDGPGFLSDIREKLRYFPEDVRKKKLAGRLYLLSQAGVYNYPRMLAHGERAGAQLALFEFVRHASAAAFLLGKTYMPFYKWQYRALAALPTADLVPQFDALLTSPNDEETASEKSVRISAVCRRLYEETVAAGLTKGSAQARMAAHPFSIANEGTAAIPRGAPEEQDEPDEPDLASLAFAVNDAIADPALRSADLLAGV